MAGHRAYADHTFDAELFLQRRLDNLGGLHDLGAVFWIAAGKDNDHIRLVDIDDEITLPVREKPLQHFHRRNVRADRLADEEDRARLVRDEMQLLGTDVHVAGEDIV